MSSLKLYTPATLYPISLAEAKLHLRVDIPDDDALILSLVIATTLDAEHIIGRALLPQKWLYSDDHFDSVIHLLMPTVTAVDWVKYSEPVAGTLTTLVDTAYQVMFSDYAAIVFPPYGQSWPGYRAQTGAVQVLFTSGYADAASVPEPIKAWIKLRIGMLYENRSSLGEDRQSAPLSINGLLDRYRVY